MSSFKIKKAQRCAFFGGIIVYGLIVFSLFFFIGLGITWFK